MLCELTSTVLVYISPNRLATVSLPELTLEPNLQIEIVREVFSHCIVWGRLLKYLSLIHI